MSETPATTMQMVGRALQRRCPRCGARNIFRSYFELHERCHGCGMLFERDPGYWVGAMIVVTTITTVLFLVLMIGGMVLTAPDVPWGWLMGITLGANLIVPIVSYSRAKMLWSALDLSWHPLEADEAAGAWSAVTAADNAEDADDPARPN